MYAKIVNFFVKSKFFHDYLGRYFMRFRRPAQPFQSVSLSVELKRKKGIDKNLIIYIIKNFSSCIFDLKVID